MIQPNFRMQKNSSKAHPLVHQQLPGGVWSGAVRNGRCRRHGCVTAILWQIGLSNQTVYPNFDHRICLIYSMSDFVYPKFDQVIYQSVGCNFGCLSLRSKNCSMSYPWFLRWRLPITRSSQTSAVRACCMSWWPVDACHWASDFGSW